MEKRFDDDEVEIDLRELFFALKKHILVILAALLAGAVIAGVYTKAFITPMYSATSTMLVLTKETTLTSLADLQLGSQLTSDYSMLITSRTVLEDVVDELNLDMDYKALKGSISINNPTDTRILEITVTNSDPKLCKTIVDTLSKTASQFIGEQMEVTAPKIIEEGEVPTAKISPNTKKNIMIGALAGLVLSAGVVVLITLMDDTIKTEEDIERYLGLSTMACVPDRRDYITGKRKKKRKGSRRKK